MMVKKKPKRGGRPKSAGLRLDRIKPWDDEGCLRIVVESPKGSLLKISFDPEIGSMKLSRPLPTGVVYPFDFGFIPGTLAPDGDPLDALVLHDFASFPGVVIACDIVGAVGIEEDSEEGKGRIRNDRILAVPSDDPKATAEHDGAALTKRWRKELEQFFQTATFFEKKNVRVVGWLPKKKAHQLVEEARKS